VTGPQQSSRPKDGASGEENREGEKRFVKTKFLLGAVVAAGISLSGAMQAQGQVKLIAKGTLTESSAGLFADLSGLDYNLENGAPANLLGGLGSALTWGYGDTFLALPDRGPNAVSFDSLVDDTVSYVPRFHTIQMSLEPSSVGLPFTLTATLEKTTLLFSHSPLTYGSGSGLGVGPRAPVINTPSRNYFSGRSDNFDASQNSGNPNNARFDSEGIRLSSDGQRVYISDEYGPYIYEFDRDSGQRIRAFKLPDHLFVSLLAAQGALEITGNSSGRVANKGMEGLAITPDGDTLVGIMQNALRQDAAQGGAAASLLRIVTVNVSTGKTTHEYAYLLTTGSGVSEITALNSHEFLVDERDGKGLGDGSKAKVKQIFKIDLARAVDVHNMDGTQAATNAVKKDLFLDVVKELTANGITAAQIPAKLEGITLGPDVDDNGTTLHTFWVANDNDFLQDLDGAGTNPNQFLCLVYRYRTEGVGPGVTAAAVLGEKGLNVESAAGRRRRQR
jgi:Esterase-like activity of phytase